MKSAKHSIKVFTKNNPSTSFFTKSEYRRKHRASITPHAAADTHTLLLGEPPCDRQNQKDVHNTEWGPQWDRLTSVILCPELVDTTRRLQHLEQQSNSYD